MSSITNDRTPAEPTLPWRLLEDYRPARRHLRRDARQHRRAAAALEAFVRSIESMGAQEFAARRDSARRAIRENGVTYNVYGDPQGIDRPWELDMVPLIVPADEWSRLEAGPDSADAGSST